MDVTFIQFLQPYARQQTIQIRVPDELRPKLDQIAQAGCRLTAEVLSTGVCSFCIEEPRIGDVEQELCQNGPDVPKAVERMISRFTLERFIQFIIDMEEVSPEL